MSFDWKHLSTRDRAIVGGAGVAFIAAFLPWYGVSVGPFSASVSGWSAGFSAWAGSLLLTAAGVLLLLRRSGAKFGLPNVGPSVLVAGVAALGLLLVIIRWVTLPRYHVVGVGYDAGARYGLYIGLIAGIVVVAAAVAELRSSGEAMPWAQAQQAQPAQPAEPPDPSTPAVPEE
jgi:hypothetical protein